jgi:hypothetical protein
MAKNAAAEDPPPDRPRPSIRSSKTPHPMPFDNPPYDDEYTYVYEDPDYYDLIEE